ncbi:hypothetical protein [Agriterribacter sp.]|uniref:hypothetical protein n=1 Tax=Agriterribacter sp. TaxID=2821509 RepID=UPI002B92E954|nr:hypothetical protein [Agriterribacter sp.]HRO47685.1 hypothetical protein [Agriterribacter sp.]HRQ17666.1 hypothetical protein [Agriterribacter sp.]
MQGIRSRQQKIDFIRKIKLGEISADQLFISTLDMDRCTVAELNFLHDMLVKGETERIVIPDGCRKQIEQLKKDYATR